MSVSQCIYTGKPVHLCVLHNELCIWIGESSTCYWYVLQLYNNLHYSAIFLLHHSRDPRSWFEIRIFVQINTFRITKQVLSHLRQYHLFEHFSPVWKNPSSNNAHKCRHCSEIVKFDRNHWVWWHCNFNIVPGLKYDKAQRTFQHRNYKSADTHVNNKKISWLFSYHVRELFVR